MDALDELVGTDPKMRERIRKAEEAAKVIDLDEAKAARASAAADRPFGTGGSATAPSLPPLTHYRGEGYRKAPQREMVVKGLMGAGELSVTYGAPKTGKSFLMTDLALAVAEGRASWSGRRIKRRGFVLYCIMEGAGGFPNRLQAWSTYHERAVPDAFVWTPVRLQFFEERTVTAVTEDMRRLQALIAELEEDLDQPCVLVVVDTAARAMTGADENSSQHMGMFLEQCRHLQELPGRPHVNVVHHEGKSGSMRGSSALLGAGDAFIRVESGADARAWSVEWAKDDADGCRCGFNLQSVSLGHDEDGDEMTSCAVVDAEAPEKPTKAAKGPQLSARQKIVLNCLEDAIVEHGEKPPGASDIPPNTYAVTVEQLRDMALRRLVFDDEVKPFHRRQAVKRALEDLQKKGVAHQVDGWCWLADIGAQNAANIANTAKRKREVEA